MRTMIIKKAAMLNDGASIGIVWADFLSELSLSLKKGSIIQIDAGISSFAVI